MSKLAQALLASDGKPAGGSSSGESSAGNPALDAAADALWEASQAGDKKAFRRAVQQLARIKG